jgi:hypothetical protein
LSSYPNTVVVDKEQLEQVNIDELKLRVNKKDIMHSYLKPHGMLDLSIWGKYRKIKKIGRLYDHE